MADWYYEFNGAQQGPVPLEQLLSLMRAGTVLPQSRVWREGMNDWAPASSMPELAPEVPSAASTPFPAGATIALTPPAGQLPPNPAELNYFNPVANQTFVYAGFWLRFVAYIIDSILLQVVLSSIRLVGLAMLHAPLIVPPGNRFGIVPGMALGGVPGLVIGWLYFALMESSVQQATLGKMALGLVVTDLEGRRVSFGRATGRFFGKILSGLMLYIGFMMAGWTERKQALHDLVAGALVVRKASMQTQL